MRPRNIKLIKKCSLFDENCSESHHINVTMLCCIIFSRCPMVVLFMRNENKIKVVKKIFGYHGGGYIATYNLRYCKMHRVYTFARGYICSDVCGIVRLFRILAAHSSCLILLQGFFQPFSRCSEGNDYSRENIRGDVHVSALWRSIDLNPTSHRLSPRQKIYWPNTKPFRQDSSSMEFRKFAITQSHFFICVE